MANPETIAEIREMIKELRTERGLPEDILTV
jgi:hypothetical protein